MINSKAKLTEYYGANKQYSIAEVLNSPFGSLRRIIREHGETFTKALLVKLVLDVNKFFNYNRTINEPQCIQTVALILECYPDYTIEDFIRCFKNMKLGRYGKFFEGMDGNKILDCLEQYGVEKENEIIEFRKKQSEEAKSSSKEINEALLPILKDVVKKLDASEKPKEQKPPRELTESEKLFNGWFAEFDTLYYQQQDDKHRKVMRGSIRMVKYNDKIMDCNKFIEVKLEEHNQQKQ